MRTNEIDRVVAEASPISDVEVRSFDFERAEAELIEEIIASPRSPGAGDLMTDAARPVRHVAQRRAVAVIAATATVVVAAFVAIGSLGGDSHPAFAAEAIKVAEANPRLLVTEPGWSVTRADEFTTDNGEMIFSNGENELEVYWRPAGDYQSFFRDRAGDSSQTKTELLGHPATIFKTTGASSYTTLLQPDGETFVEIRGDGYTSQDAYLQIVRTLRPTDVDTWLGAMPTSVVSPTDRAATVNEMLQGIPLPPGFDVSALQSGEIVSDRYQLGAQVAGAVACDWLNRWTAAIKSGDTAKAQEAQQAMATSRTWPILLEMDQQGDYPEEVWDWRDRLGASGFGPNTTHNYSPSLGCSTR